VRSWTSVGFGILFLALLISAALAFASTGVLAANSDRVEHAQEVISCLESLLRTVTDAETGQRGYLLTGGRNEYLRPYEEAVSRVGDDLARLRGLATENPARRDRLDDLAAHIDAKLHEMARTIRLRKEEGPEAALREVQADKGLRHMEAVRSTAAEIEAEERELLRASRRESAAGVAASRIGIVTGTALGVALLGLAYASVRREDRVRRAAAEGVRNEREWFETTLLGIGDGVIVTDGVGRVRLLNAVAEHLTGWSRDNATGRLITEVFPIVNETTRAVVENPLERCLREGTVVGLANHTVLLGRDGVERPIDDSGAPVRDAAGNVAGAVLVFRDVTKRRREEAGQSERLRLVALHADVSSALASARPTAAALQAGCEALVRHLGVAFARVWTLNEAEAALELQASAGLYTHLNGPHRRVPVGQFKIGRIAASGQPHLTNAVPDDPNVGDRDWARREGMVAFAGYPLTLEGRVVGVVAMFARHSLSEGVLTALAPLAEEMAQFVDRRRSEQVVREQRELLRVTLASIGDAVLTTDSLGKVTFLNAVAEGLTGWTSEQAAGRPVEAIFDIVKEFTGDAVENPVGKVLRQGVTVGLANHTVLIGRDGSRRPIDDSAAPIRDERGGVVGVVLVFRDVSEQRRAEQALRESEERHRLIAELSTDYAATFLADEAGGLAIESATDGFARVTGCTPAELEKRGGWTSLVHPDDLPVLRRSVHRWLEGQTDVSEFRIVTGGGEIRWQQYLGRARGEPLTGGRRPVVVAARDVTERKRNEAALAGQKRVLELLVQGAPLPDVLDTLCEIVEGQSPHRPVATVLLVDADGQRLRSVAGRRAPEAYARAVDGVRIGLGVGSCGTAAYRGEAVVVADIATDPLWADFRELALSHGLRACWSTPIFSSQGSVLGTFAVYHHAPRRPSPEEARLVDVVARTAGVAVERRRAEEALREADRRKDEFLATLAHELRNPLAPMRNALQVMQLAGGEPAVVGPAREMIERQMRHLVRLVDDLLDVSRITRGKMELRTQRIDLAAVVHTAVETSRPLIDAARHELSLSLPPFPIFVNGDPVRLAQVFSNLLNNAAKYTEAGGSITLTVERHGSDAVVSVRDNGLGIPAEMLGKVFELFTQIDGTLERSQGGLGIGLTLVRRLVEMHGGRVDARSEGQGHGSEFVVRLPAVLATPANDEGETREHGRIAHRRRILVVDDNRDSAISLGMMLELMGSEVRTAHDGFEALQAAEVFRPDVALLDIGLPGLNGYEVARRIRAQPWGRDVVLLALTGWGQEEDKRRSKEAGFNFHMVKPVEPADLEKLLVGLSSPA
jgi:PAS domain S-box-containing protein